MSFFFEQAGRRAGKMGRAGHCDIKKELEGISFLFSN